MRDLIASLRDAVCQVICRDSHSVGSGFFVGSDLVISCNHVVAQEKLNADGLVELKYSDEITVTSSQGTFRASVAHKLQDLDPYFHDYTILRVNTTDHPYLLLGGYDAVYVGDDVLVLGYPLGVSELTATKGMVATKHRSPSHMNQIIHLDMIRIDGTINPGNSGGPLSEPNGTVVGIVSLRLGSIQPEIDRLRTILAEAEKIRFDEDPNLGLFTKLLDLFERSNTYLNPGLGEAVSIQYVRDKLREIHSLEV